jgi:(E)-4-hydroxy-3-methylbut-2-enyl-diphosphate synthase
MDGIGDTIRVSLTEDPCREIPVAKRLVALCGPQTSPLREGIEFKPSFDPFVYARRHSAPLPYGVHQIGGSAPVLTTIALPVGFLRRADSVARLRRLTTPPAGGGPCLEGVLVPWADLDLTATFRSAAPGLGIAMEHDERGPNEPRSAAPGAMAPISPYATSSHAREHGDELRKQIVPWHRAMAARYEGIPLIVDVPLPADPTDALLYGAAVAGSLLCDGIGDAVRFGGPHEPERLLEMVLGVLQACRLRASRTEYIACPGCGRTLFDLESTTQRIKARTGHLPGVKIAVMGCIVNGPGEMADADFGYVGSAPGFVNLYVGKDIVVRNVPQKDADERLIALLKSHGVWREPAAAATA